MEKLVSIITPCFNGEGYIERYLDSILAQTYPKIELIIIDDGSTDRTSEIISKYKTKFTKRDLSLIYKYQKNSGQAAALNEGLQLFSGEYFTWPDSDDFLSPNSIELRVLFLEQNLKYAFVRSDAAFFDENNLKKIKYFATSNVQNKYKENLFDSLILETDSYLCNGTYLLKKNAFLDINPTKSIYASRTGQNWQMILPMAYHYLCGYIDEPLYNIVIRKTSHSRNALNKDNSIARVENLEELLLKTVLNIVDEKHKYEVLIKRKYLAHKFLIYCKHSDYKNAERIYLLKESSRSKFFFYIESRWHSLIYRVKNAIKNLI